MRPRPTRLVWLIRSFHCSTSTSLSMKRAASQQPHLPGGFAGFTIGIACCQVAFPISIDPHKHLVDSSSAFPPLGPISQSYDPQPGHPSLSATAQAPLSTGHTTVKKWPHFRKQNPLKKQALPTPPKYLPLPTPKNHPFALPRFFNDLTTTPSKKKKRLDTNPLPDPRFFKRRKG